MQTVGDVIAFLEIISGGISSQLVIIGFVAACSKKVRKMCSDGIRKCAGTDEIKTEIKAQSDNLGEVKMHMEDHVKISEAKFSKTEGVQLSILRNMITDIYYRYKDAQKLPMYEKESLHHMYDDYVSRGGNSYIPSIVEIMDKWETE